MKLPPLDPIKGEYPKEDTGESFEEWEKSFIETLAVNAGIPLSLLEFKTKRELPFSYYIPHMDGFRAGVLFAFLEKFYDARGGRTEEQCYRETEWGVPFSEGDPK